MDTGAAVLLALTSAVGPAAGSVTWWHRPRPVTAYVTNEFSDSVTPIRTATNTAGTSITVGSFPAAIAITPNGKTAYVSNVASDTVSPINTGTNTAGTAIPVGLLMGTSRIARGVFDPPLEFYRPLPPLAYNE